MAEITEKELKKQIANGMFSPVYLLYGEEAFLKQYYAGLIAEKSVAKGFETFNLHKLEGKETSLDEIADAAEQLPMMAERTCVLVRDFDLKALKGAQREKLEAFLSDPPGTCSVVFWMDTVEVAPKQNKDWQGIIKLFAKSGAAVRLSRRTSVELTRQLCASAKKRGGSLPLEAASYLVAYSGSDLNLLINELDKLCAYAAGREITQRDIDAVCIKSVEATAFDMVKALLRGKYADAYGMLDALFAQKTEPVMIAGALISSYVDMNRAKAALASGERVEAVAQAFNYKGREFRLRYAAQDASRLTLAQLGTCLDILSEADEALKSTRAEKRLVLEEAMLRLQCVASG